jgi:hypothetical protein
MRWRGTEWTRERTRSAESDRPTGWTPGRHRGGLIPRTCVYAYEIRNLAGPWENADGRRQAWREHELQSGLQTHESVAADVDGDGGIDMLTKPWSVDLHVFVENRLKVKMPEIEIKAKQVRIGFKPWPMCPSWTARISVVSGRHLLISSQDPPAIYITTAPLVPAGLPT